MLAVRTRRWFAWVGAIAALGAWHAAPSVVRASADSRRSCARGLQPVTLSELLGIGTTAGETAEPPA
jgi:hypothetical protein